MSELSKEQLKELVIEFYDQVKADDLLGPIFNDVAKVDWEHHIPLLTGFWCNIMLGTNDYRGGAYGKHVALSQIATVTMQHFERWLMLFEKVAQAKLPEPDAKLIVERANMIARSLQFGMGLS